LNATGYYVVPCQITNGKRWRIYLWVFWLERICFIKGCSLMGSGIPHSL
jgi:hypothetical protein